MQNFSARFSDNLKQVLVTGENFAVQVGDVFDTNHLIYSILSSKDTLASDFLRNSDITLEKVNIVNQLISRGSHNYKSIKISDDVKSSLMRAIKEASNFGHATVETEHLLLALLENKNFKSYHLIERVGGKPLDLARELSKYLIEISKTDREQKEPLDFHPDAAEDFFGDSPILDNLSPISEPAGASSAPPVKMLELYGKNLNQLSRDGKLDPVFEREVEIQRLVQILGRRKKNNPMLIGEPGVGKTAVIEGLANKIVKGEVPAFLINKKIVLLDLGGIVAGTMFRGQFESRFNKIIEEIREDKNTIIFIDEIHTIIGAGGAEGALDASNLLKPILNNGEIRIIGATTLDEYQKNIEKDRAFERRFQVVTINEPTIKTSIKILNGIAPRYEKFHHVRFTKEAVLSAVNLSDRYISDRYLPDKAIDLLDEAATVSLSVINQKDHQLIAKYKKQLADIIQHKNLSIENESYEEATKYRQQEILTQAKIDSLVNQQAPLIQREIDDQIIAKLVADMTGIPVSELKSPGKINYLSLEKNLDKYIIGQSEAIKEIAGAMRRSRAGVTDPDRPIGSFLFMGPTGVGKTETAKVLARLVFGSDESLVRIDMSEFMERHNLSRLIGAPAGYVGYDEGGRLTEKIRHQPHSLVLLDEIEKAHPDIYHILLQILDDGFLTDSKGRKVNFRNTLIIMTSNLGGKLFTDKGIGFTSNIRDDDSKISHKIDDIIKNNFPLELINRIDKIIFFDHLKKNQFRKIVNLRLLELCKRLAKKGLKLTTSESAINALTQRGYDYTFGARPLERLISTEIENPISDLILNDPSQQNNSIKVDLVDDKFVIHGF